MTWILYLYGMNIFDDPIQKKVDVFSTREDCQKLADQFINQNHIKAMCKQEK